MCLHLCACMHACVYVCVCERVSVRWFCIDFDFEAKLRYDATLSRRLLEMAMIVHECERDDSQHKEERIIIIIKGQPAGCR